MQTLQTEASPPAGGRTARANPAPIDDPRVYLAAERTFLAWVRTSVALMGFGFLIARFAFWLRDYAGLPGETPAAHHRHVSPWLGFGMVVVAVIVLVTAAMRHGHYVRALKDGVPNPPLDLWAPLTVAAILGLVGLAMAIQILLF